LFGLTDPANQATRQRIQVQTLQLNPEEIALVETNNLVKEIDKIEIE